MKFIYLLIILMTCSPNRKEVAKEDYSNLFEIALNICPEIKKYYHFEFEDRKVINMLIGESAPLNRSIKCFGYKVNYKRKYINDKSTWIEIWNYQKVSADKFYLLYKIQNEEVFVEMIIEKLKGKWYMKECKIDVNRSK